MATSIVKEKWFKDRVTSTFQVDISNEQFLTKGLYTEACGLGWRFKLQNGSSWPSKFTHQIVVFFETLQLHGRDLGGIQCSIVREPAFPALDSPSEQSGGQDTSIDLRYTTSHQIATYEVPDGERSITLTVTVTFSTLRLPFPLSIRQDYPKVMTALHKSLSGKDIIDTKFFMFSRSNPSRKILFKPLPLFASSSLLQGHSAELDSLLFEDRFLESAIVDLDAAPPGENQYPMLDSTPDSDLSDSEFDELTDEDASQPPKVGPSTTAEDWDLDSSTHTPSSKPESDLPKDQQLPCSRDEVVGLRRMGRVIQVKDTAYKTWRALVIYLYTGELEFAPSSSAEAMPARISVQRRPLDGKNKKKKKGKGPAAPTIPEPIEILDDAPFPLLTHPPPNPSPSQSAPRPASPKDDLPKINRCSPKSMYRLADKLGMDELRLLCITAISKQLSSQNIVEEYFSKFTSMYPAVQKVEMAILRQHYGAPGVSTALKRKVLEMFNGDGAHGVDAFMTLLDEIKL